MRQITLVLYILAFAIVAYAGKIYVDHSRAVPRTHPEPPGHLGCREIVSHALYGCPDGHAYTVDAQGWHDVGPLSPMPGVPR